MASGANDHPDYDQTGRAGELKVKVICLGDSAVGKSKKSTYLMKLDEMNLEGPEKKMLVPVSGTFFDGWLTVFRSIPRCWRYLAVRGVLVEMKNGVYFWDTAGQERFNSMHPSYYHQAHACILVFDTTRKITYKNLPIWYQELRTFRPEIPCFCVANKIDVDLKVTQKGFNFPKKHNLPFYFVSASDGTNVVKLFRDAIKAAVKYKKNPTDFTDEVLEELERLESGLTPFDEDEEKEDVNDN